MEPTASLSLSPRETLFSERVLYKRLKKMAYSTNINLVLGPLVIGTLLNFFLYGICFVQFYTYWGGGFKDRYIIQ